MTRKILILSTTFFPDPGVAAIRMTQWCRHLPEHGWKPYVLCRYYGFDATPEQLATNVHPDVSVKYLDKEDWGAATSSPGRTYGRLRRRLGRLFAGSVAAVSVPDVTIYAWRRFRPQILAYVREIQPDVIVTTSPPHSNHDIGLWLARETGIPWVADFRDPYLLDDRFRPSGLAKLRWRSHERFKNMVYRRAQLITHAIPLQARWSRINIPNSRERVRILPNAFPSELLEDLAQADEAKAERKTVLVAGTIPEPEQLRLAEAVKSLTSAGHDLQLKLLGKRADCEPQLHGLLGDRLLLPGYVSHRDSMREVAKADILVNYLDDFRSRTLLLSTKLIEYLATGKPVICINPSRSDRHLLRNRHNASILRDPSAAELTSALGRQLDNPSPCDEQELGEYQASFHWDGRVAQLADWLREIVEPPAVRPPGEFDGPPPRATVVITTRNRKEDLRIALASVFKQNVPVETLVMDDASDDGTAEMVAREFPGAKVLRTEKCVGLIVQRNRAARAATTNHVFSLDDDAEFSAVDTVEKTLSEFDDERVGAVAIPHIDTRTGNVPNAAAPVDGRLWCVASFVGTAHAVRRDIFVRLGGYCDELVHQGEESDYCLRLLEAGYVVRLGQADKILHHESPRRSFERMDYYGRRNDVGFAWRHTPLLWVTPHLLGTTFNGVRFAWSTGRPKQHLRGLANGWSEIFSGRTPREPVAAAAYHLFRMLKKNGPLPLSKIESRLPRLARAKVVEYAKQMDVHS